MECKMSRTAGKSEKTAGNNSKMESKVPGRLNKARLKGNLG
jgi:hypothetical protein